jgi:hypothetical protein
VRDEFSTHLSVNNLLSSCQHGVLSGRSCTTNLLTTLEKWTLKIDEGLPVDIIYLDYAKAFDAQPYERLLRKVKSLGIDGKSSRLDQRLFDI